MTENESGWGTPVDVERRRRIMVAAAAWAYEHHHDPIIMTDEEFDRECLAVDLSIDTGNPTMDAWFRKHFEPYTGQWVHKHPEKGGLERIYQRAAARRRGLPQQG